MPFCAKDTACTKAGKLKKGFKEVQCKNGSVKYMTDNVKKPIAKARAEKKEKEPKIEKKEKKMKVEKKEKNDRIIKNVKDDEPKKQEYGFSNLSLEEVMNL